MDSARGTWLTLVLSVGVTGVLLTQLSSRFHSPYPSMETSLRGSQTSLQDVAGIALGIRRLMADLAWIQTLDYYGTQEEGQSEYEFENGLGVYPDFMAHCMHVARLDPYFTYVYYYGGGVLGWNLNRLSEAEELIREGIKNNPTEWRLLQYLAALAYQKNHDNENLIKYLESITADSQSPLMMKVLLANIYKKKHQYDDALRMWLIIYSSGDPHYMQRAAGEFNQIKALMKSHPSPHRLTK